MNVEKLQKMNELAKELKQHGLANSMDEAYNQADGMINSETFVEIRSMMEKGKSAQAEAASEPAGQVRVSNQMNEVLEKISAQNSKIDQMGSTIMKMQEVMNDIISEFVKLKEAKSAPTHAHVAHAEPVAERPRQMMPEPATYTAPQLREVPPVATVSASAQPAVSASTTRGMYADKNTSNNHPRQGGYTPNDVSIEKFFNTGHMRT